jgi:peptidoglycan/LPS O-acetylase OafA/YrhL
MFKRQGSDETPQSQESGAEKGKRQRLMGLDLFRGIAAFAVVIMHSDEGVAELPVGWESILNFVPFAVPFFLAASFYLTMGKLSSGKSVDWRSRLSRLLIPYSFWSLVYVGLDLARFTAKYQPDKIWNLLQNTPGIIFLGQAAFHLYFIPLLVTGMLIVVAAEPLFRKPIKIPTLLGFLTFSLLFYQAYQEFSLGTLERAAIEPAVGPLGFGIVLLLLKIMGYGIRSLPYVATALLLNHPLLHRRLAGLNIRATAVLLVMFLIINILPFSFIPSTIHEMLRAYSTLLLALALSNCLKPQSVVASIGNCSFGIYLMHLLIVQIFTSVAGHFNFFTRVSLVSLLTVAIVGFGLSWLLSLLLIRSKAVSKIMFGI